LFHETIIEGKTTRILPKIKGKASYTQDIGETEVGPSKYRERLLQRTKIDEPVLGDPTRNSLESPQTTLFQQVEVRILQGRHVKIVPDSNPNPTKFLRFINSPSVNLASKSQLVVWRGHSIAHVIL
jgi:hypothetical protein